MYRAFTSFEFDGGIWGLFRVLCNTNADCDDGLFCNGQETCFVGTCLPGAPVDCNDGVACTIDTCNETTLLCDNVPDNAVCDDGLACNGVEVCDPVLDCPVVVPCPGLTTADLTTTLTPANLASALAGFVGATAPTISNVVYTGANTAAGTFGGGSGIVGFFQTGVVLSTGNIADVIGPNAQDATTTDNGTAGDLELDPLMGAATHDAAVLEFDFDCPGNTPGLATNIVFNYVLASESYNEGVGGPAEGALGLFVNGFNVALLNDGITPVSVSNVNCGNPFTPPTGGLNCEQFVNNDCSEIGAGTFPCEGNVNTEMDGLTTVMTALSPVVLGTNHMKLVIGDSGPLAPDSAVFILGGSFERQNANFPPVPRSLKSIAVPGPSNLMNFVKGKTAAIQLGKALFWDMQTGSDGMQACATCHFNAGADARIRKTLNPGANGIFNVGGPNYTLQSTDFPFASVPTPLEADDIVGSQGVVRRDFVSVVPGSVEDNGVPIPDPVHNVAGINTRRVTGRNTPTVINAVFNTRNFWDGRANFVFNGVNPFGLRDPNNPTILEVQPDGTVLAVSVVLEQSSLASQAMAPPPNNTEMSWNGRIGDGGMDPFGNPLSFTLLSQQGVVIGPPFAFPVAVDPLARVAVDGSFKTAGLRNVELTGPYMHNGGMETLQQVVEFYARGGDFPDVNVANLAPLIQTLPLTALDRANLVAFLKSLTDERVRLQKAPFDHPQLFVPHGHVGDDIAVVPDGNGAGVDCLVELPAVGVTGTTPVPLSTQCLVLCGNGVIDLSEDCDDWNTANGDCCSSTCQFDAPGTACPSSIPCAASSCDGFGVCQAGATACTNPCEQCNPGLNACDWCIFDHNFSGTTDGLDFAFFSGCFGGCYSSVDPCIAANYDGDAFGCVGGGDFAGLSGCFGLTCGQCPNCWGLTGGGPSPEFPGGESASGTRAAVQLVAVTVATAKDFAPALPDSVERLEPNAGFDLEIWASRGNDGVDSGDGLASVYVDLRYDPGLLLVKEIVPGVWFKTFGRGVTETEGHIEAVGGCAPVGEGSLGTDGEWAHVATVRMHVESQGVADVTVAPAFRPFGISIHDRLGDVPPSRVKFGGVTLKLGATRRRGGDVK